jgi:hypothetical protein
MNDDVMLESPGVVLIEEIAPIEIVTMQPKADGQDNTGSVGPIKALSPDGNCLDR